MLENSTSIPFLVGAVFLFAGILMFVFPPKKINYLYGYRTRSSMKSIERWNFAQKPSSRLMMVCGILLLITGVIGEILFQDQSAIKNVGIAETILMTIFLFVKTELDLMNKFGKTL